MHRERERDGLGISVQLRIRSVVSGLATNGVNSKRVKCTQHVVFLSLLQSVYDCTMLRISDGRGRW